VFIFRFKKDGAFMPDLIAETHASLDTVQNAAGDVCLVITGEDKTFSTGFNLEYAAKATADEKRLLMTSGDTILNSVLLWLLYILVYY
jgi:enoyl-CoA hydratase/carnithine racemase